MKSPAERSFLARVRNALPNLHPAERRLGEFVCNFPGELASYDAQELAKYANVSKATVSRFVRRIGYENYEEARRHARAERRTGSRLFMAHAAEPDAPDASMTQNVEQGKLNLERTFAAITQQEIDEVANAILKARKIWVIGFRASRPFADYLRWQLLQVVENVISLPGPGETLGEQLVSIQKDDCVVLFSLRRRVAINDRILSHIAGTGAAFVYVTDEGLEPERSARWHFRCQTMAPGALFNHVSVMALCHLLVVRSIELAGAPGRARLRNIEVLNDGFEEL